MTTLMSDESFAAGLANAPGRSLSPFSAELLRDRVVKRGDAVVVEARGNGAEDGHRLGRGAERLAVALHLLAHVAQGILAAFAVELVDRRRSPRSRACRSSRAGSRRPNSGVMT